MQVSSSTGLSTSPTSSTSSTSSSPTATPPTVNYTEFLQLLITEMKNQDPTSPMDPTQSVSQLATFSQVEQQVQTNSTLTAMLNASSIAQADSMIGHTLTSADGLVSGIVTSVNIDTSGSTALLSDGSVVPLGNGVTVS